MFHATIDVKLFCPRHPDFDPSVAMPDKKCRCCQSINNIRHWVFMAQRAATRVVQTSAKSDLHRPASNVAHHADPVDLRSGA